MFDSERHYDIKLLSGDKITVRFPTDQEWTERQRKRKLIVRDLGRGTSETTTPGGEEVDQEFLAKIAISDVSAVEPAEAARVIDLISKCDVEEVVKEADNWRVSLRVPGGTTQIVIGQITAGDMSTYRREFVKVHDLPHGRRQIVVNLMAADALFKKVVVGVTGYKQIDSNQLTSGVPITHKNIALKAAFDALEASVDDGDDFLT